MFNFNFKIIWKAKSSENYYWILLEFPNQHFVWWNSETGDIA